MLTGTPRTLVKDIKNNLCQQVNYKNESLEWKRGKITNQRERHPNFYLA